MFLDQLHRLHRIAREVQDDLLDHGPIALDRRQAVVQPDLGSHTQFARLQLDQRHDGIEYRMGVDGLMRAFAPSHEVMHALDDLAGALRLIGNMEQSLLQLPRDLQRQLAQRPFTAGAPRQPEVGGGKLLLCGVQHVDRAGRVAGDGSQRLVQFMAKQRCHLSDRCQPRGGLQPLT